MRLVYSAAWATPARWGEALEAAARLGAEGLCLRAAPADFARAEVRPRERFLDRFERDLRRLAVRVVAIDGAATADPPPEAIIAGDRPELRHTVCLKQMIDLAWRLGVPFLTYESARDGYCPEDRLSSCLWVLEDIGRYAGKRRVRLAVAGSALGTRNAGDLRRLMLSRRANAVGVLGDAGLLGSDVDGALEDVGEFLLLGRIAAGRVLDGTVDVAGLFRALGRWFDGDVEVVGVDESGADYAAAVEHIRGLAPGLDALRSPSDYTKMSFPSSVGRLLIGEGTAAIDPAGAHVAGSRGTWRLR